MTALGILWYILIFVLISGYFVLDGFDLGAGALYPFLAKDEREKAIVRNAIGPVWDGNEVWLLTGGGALFAAFAPAYATCFSGFYLAIMLVLFGLIIRAVSLEFRAHEDRFPKLLDGTFFVGSLFPALLFGVAAGNVIAGVPLDANGDYTGTFFMLLNPFALCCGVLGLVHMLLQGSSWLALKAPKDSELRERAAALRPKLAIADLVVFVLVTALFFLVVEPDASYEVGSLVIAGAGALVFVLGTAACFALSRGPKRGTDLTVFIAVSLAAVGLVVVWGATTFPNLVPSTSAALSLTVANSAATDATLLPMTIIAAIGVPIMLVYHVIAYRIFSGRIKLK